MSEIDPFSDGEWLDIASSRDFSSDNDSLASDDTDHDEIDSFAHSRRSSMSLGSSRDGEVDAWEGLIEDTEDEAVAAAQLETGMYPIPVPLPSNADRTESLSSIIPAGFIPDIEQPEEDQRVKDALDQSLIGTLSASRSSNGTVPNSTHTSIRDLRLSFPDPLSSSRNELNRSYDDVTADEAGLSSFTTEAEPEIVVPTSLLSAESLLSEQGPVVIPTATEVPLPVHKVKDYPKAGLDIVLYGAPSTIKWSFVQELVSKAASVSGQTVIDTLEFVNGPVQALRLQKSTQSSSILTDCILVHDRTTDSLTPVNSAFQSADRPSLAIVFLPCTSLFSLPSHHSAYLPVIVPSIRHIDAEGDWTLLSSAIPRAKVTQLSSHKLYDASRLEDINPIRAYKALHAVLQYGKKPLAKSIVGQFGSKQGATLFALVTIIMGFAINTALRPSSPIPTPTVSNAASTAQPWGLPGPDVNRSDSISATISEGSAALIPSSLKDFALSVINPGVTSLSVTSSTSKAPTSYVAVRSAARVEECSDCVSLTLTEVPKSSKEVSVHAVPTVKAPEVRTKPSVHVAPSTGKVAVRPDPTSTTLSLRVIDSLSEIVGQSFKAVVNVVRQDLQELVDAMDALMNAIQTHAEVAVRSSKGKARAIGERMQSMKERIQYRNDRAHNRARELKKKGKEILATASERFAGRTSIAKTRARRLKKSITGMPSDAWRVYEKTRLEWVTRLKERKAAGEDGEGYMFSRRHCTRGKVLRSRKDREWQKETCGGFWDRL